MAKIKRSDPRVSLAKNKVTVGEAYELFLTSRKSRCSEATIGIYTEKRNHIVSGFSRFGSGTMSEITAPIIRAVIADYQDTHTVNGAWKLFTVIRTFLLWYWDEYEIETACPIHKVQVHKPAFQPKHGITRKEIDSLLKAIKNSSRFPERDTCLVMLLADTGLRKKSVQGLRMKDVNLQTNAVYVFEKDQNYHNKTFGANTAKAIRKYLGCLEDISKDDPFFLNQDGTEMTENSMRMMLERMADAAGIQRHLFHDFRRFYGLELYRQTHDIYFVSRMLDHKDVEVTKRYLAIDDMEDAEKMARVSPMDYKAGQTGITIRRR
jgi:site-specific recombinase XerD